MENIIIVGAIGAFIYMLLKDKSTFKSTQPNIVPDRFIVGYNLPDKEYVRNKILSLGGSITVDYQFINFFVVDISDNLISEVSKINGVTSITQEQLMNIA